MSLENNPSAGSAAVRHQPEYRVPNLEPAGVDDRDRISMRRRQKARPGELRVTYGSLRGDNPDVVFSRGEGVPSCDGHLMNWYFTQASADPGLFSIKRIEEELRLRGYDLSTMVFSVMKKADA